MMIRTMTGAALLALASVMPAQQAAAQEGLIGGAIFGGATGAIIGGAVGGRGGAATGAIIGPGGTCWVSTSAQKRA